MLKKVPDEVREKIRQQIPVGRFGKPAEVAALVAFLAGDEFAAFLGTEKERTAAVLKDLGLIQ